MKAEAYLFLEGRCEEAIAFYRRALGADVEMMMRFDESPDPPPPGMLPPGSGRKIMHASLRVGETLVMLSDGMCGGTASFSGFAVSVSVATEAEADRMFGALGEGGTVRMPIGPTFWSPRFGMVADRFGVMWMVNCSPAP